jgi:thioesterase domain-containing protein
LNILGYSFGGTVAIETARLAQEAGREVNLFVVDSMDNSLPVTEETWQDISNMIKPEEIEKIVKDAAQNASRTVMPFALKRVETAWDPASAEYEHVRHWKKAQILDRSLALVDKNLHDLVQHNLKPYSGPMVLFRTEGNAMHGFHDKVKDLEEIKVGGTHFHLLDQADSEMEKIMNRISQAMSYPGASSGSSSPSSSSSPTTDIHGLANAFPAVPQQGGVGQQASWTEKISTIVTEVAKEINPWNQQGDVEIQE